MKVLLLGDASNYHRTLATGLSALGHDVTVASNGSRWMDTGREIDLSRKSGKIGGAILWLRLNTVLASRLKGYDVVQIVNPVFVELQPKRIAPLFTRLKRDNGKVFLTALGTDLAYVEMALSADNPLRYTEWSVDGRPTPFALSHRGALLKKWLDEPLRSHARFIYENIDGAVSALYEYHLAMRRVLPADKIAYGGIPVDLTKIEIENINTFPRPLRVLAPYHEGREQEKGTDILRDILRDVPGLHTKSVTGLPFQQFVECLKDCDVVLDQYYSYTPATTALMAMAMGKIVVTGAEPEFQHFVGQPIPAINVDPLNHDSLKRQLSHLNELTLRGDFDELTDFGHRARDFVARNNAAEVVARRFVDFWQR